MAGMKGRSGGPRENAGGARPGAGRKPEKARIRTAKALQTDDPDDFLRAVMRDPKSDFKDRMAAALALKKTDKGASPLGKRQQQQAAAQAVVDRSLAPVRAPSVSRPKLAVVK